MTGPDDSSGTGKPFSKNAQNLEASIKGKVDDLLETTAGSEPELSPEAKGMLLGSTIVDLMNEHAKLDDEDKSFSARPLWVWLLLIAIVALGAAAIAGAMIFLRDDGGGGTAAGGVAAPAAQPVPAADAAQAPAAGTDAPPVSGECAVSPASLAVASTDIRSDQGVNDPAMFVVEWTAVVTNNSDETILFTAKIASSDNGGSGAWDATTFGRAAPGETYLWPTRSQVTNNAGGAAGPTTWRYVDQILAVRDSPGCEDLLVSPTAETVKAAIPADIPPMPANAQLPDR